MWQCLTMTFVYISCLTQVFIFFGEMFLSMNWAIVADILLVNFLLYFLIFVMIRPAIINLYHIFLSLSVSQYVVVPTRRSTAEAFQIVLSHLLGDAGSPYLIGKVWVTVTDTHTQ